MQEYSIQSKEAGRHGKLCLISFASKPIWQDHEDLKRQNHTPGSFTKSVATYALSKYANKEKFEIVTFEAALNELNQYKKQYPEFR